MNKKPKKHASSEPVTKVKLKKSGLTDEEKGAKIEELQNLREEYFDKAYAMTSKIDELMLDGLNYEGKVLQRVEYGEEKCDFMIVKSQSFGSDRRIYLSGLNFYANFNEGDAEVAEVFFHGYHTWVYDINEFLNLEKPGSYKMIKVLDKDKFTEKIKGYVENLKNFINGWIDEYFNPNPSGERQLIFG